MSPIDYALTPFRKYADFSGRARRSEYWWFVLMLMVIGFVVGLTEAALGLNNSFGPYGIITIAFWLAIIIPSLSVGVRRLHDTGRSGWWLLIALIPIIGSLILLVFYVFDGERGDNAYGPDPKASEHGAAAAY